MSPLRIALEALISAEAALRAANDLLALAHSSAPEDSRAELVRMTVLAGALAGKTGTLQVEVKEAVDAELAARASTPGDALISGRPAAYGAASYGSLSPPPFEARGKAN